MNAFGGGISKKSKFVPILQTVWKCKGKSEYIDSRLKSYMVIIGENRLLPIGEVWAGTL